MIKTEIVVPSFGESIVEGDIIQWRKASGDIVKQDEVLVEIDTDKTSVPITATNEGKLTILKSDGVTVEVGETIGYIEEVLGKEATKDEKKSPEKEGEISEKKPHAMKAQEADSEKLASPSDSPSSNENQLEDNILGESSLPFSHRLPSPAAKKLILEHDLSRKDIPGTGRGGRITKEDVLQQIEHQKRKRFSASNAARFYPSNTPMTSPDETITMFRDNISRGNTPTTSPMKQENAAKKNQKRAIISPSTSIKASSKEVFSDTEQPENSQQKRTSRREKITRIRKTIAKHLREAQQKTAMATTFNEVNMAQIKTIRKEYKDIFQEKHDVGLGFMSFFTKAVCQALQKYPIIHAQMDEEAITYFDYYDISIAVSTPKGLVTPVIRNADDMTLYDIEREINRLANAARNGLLSIGDMKGGTFTITNGGVFGSMLSTPMINYPQSAILGMHNIVERAVVESGEIVIRPIMYLALSYDHRLIDGANAIQFLVKIKELCEDPIRLLLEL